MQTVWRRQRALSVAILVAAATLHVGGLFTHWAPRPGRSGLPHRAALNPNSDNDLAKEVQAIIDELRLDESLPDGLHRLQPHALQAPPIPKAASMVPDAAYMSAQSLRDQLEVEERKKQELLEVQKIHDLELQRLREQQELLQREEKKWSTRPPLPPASREAAPATSPAPVSQVADGLLTALRQWGIRSAPELGQDMFVASLPQIRMLIRAQGEQAGRNHVAGLQALQRYVEQLEMDLDQKEEELSTAKSQLRQEEQRREEAQEGVQLQVQEAAQSEALTTAQAEVARLQEALANALQGQQEAESQMQEQIARAEAAEAKLVNLVERIRGAATARAAR